MRFCLIRWQSPTVDGRNRNPAPIDMWFIPLFLGCQHVSTIHSRSSHCRLSLLYPALSGGKDNASTSSLRSCCSYRDVKDWQQLREMLKCCILDHVLTTLWLESSCLILESRLYKFLCRYIAILNSPLFDSHFGDLRNVAI